MLNVLHIVLGLEIGGLEKFVLDLVRDSQEEVVPQIVCLQKIGALGEKLSGVTITELGVCDGFKFGTVWAIAKLIKNSNADIIHTHNPAPHFYGALAGLLTGVPVVHTKHGRNYPGSRKRVFLNRLSTALTARLVPVSHEAANVSRSIEKIPEKKIHPIWNGVDVRIFSIGDGRKKYLASLGIHEGHQVVGIVARLSPEKNHACLLQAFAEIYPELPLARLLIIGDGVLRAQLEAEVRALRLEGGVVFTGARHDVPDLLRECDVFALSSTTEGLPLTVLEAMACGLPVVATDVGGNSEAVRDGETGFLVPSGDHHALAKHLKRLLLDPHLASRMGCAGRQRAEDCFDSRVTARKYAELYRSVIGRRK